MIVKFKMHFSGFMVDSAFDEIAIEELKAKNYEKAINIWKNKLKTLYQTNQMVHVTTYLPLSFTGNCP